MLSGNTCYFGTSYDNRVDLYRAQLTDVKNHSERSREQYRIVEMEELVGRNKLTGFLAAGAKNSAYCLSVKASIDARAASDPIPSMYGSIPNRVGK